MNNTVSENNTPGIVSGLYAVEYCSGAIQNFHLKQAIFAAIRLSTQ